MPKDRKQCLGVSALTRTRCEKLPLRGGDYCFYHDAEYLEQHQCKATNRGTNEQCRNIAQQGMPLCEIHAGKIPIPIRVARRQLAGLVPKALQALEAAIEHGDWPTVVRAAQVILDRAGLGPHATLNIEQTKRDLSELSDDELEERAHRVFEALQKARVASQHYIDHPIVPSLPQGNGDGSDHA
jgi:hypothetical protein